MNTDDIFTVIYFSDGLYHSYETKLERIRKKHNLFLNESKTVNLTYEDIYGIYMVFGYEELIKIIINKLNKHGNIGTSTISENETNNAIKTIMFNDKEKPYLIIHKGIENAFYKEFISFCIGIGCTISKVRITKNGNYEEVYKKRKLSDENIINSKRTEDIKDTTRELFLSRINELKKTWNADNLFIIKWLELIDNDNRI